MKNRIRTGAVALGVSFMVAGLSACGPSGPTSSKDDVTALSSIVGDWTLTEWTGSEDAEVFSGENAQTLNIDKDGVVSGNAGCNSFMGQASVPSEGMITLGPLSTTLMWCEGDNLMSAETAYVDALSSVDQVSLDEVGLILTGGDQELHYVKQ